MIFIFIGIVVGCVLGNAALGHDGGSIGLVLGALAGWLMRHNDKIGALEKTIKQLTKQLAEQKLAAAVRETHEPPQQRTHRIPDDVLPVEVQRAASMQSPQPDIKQHNT